MDASFSEEQGAIQRALRDVLAARSEPDDVRAAVRTEAGYDRELWGSLARELGLPGLALPAEYDGVGCGTVELALAFEEAGRALLPSPLLATAGLVAPLVAALGTEEQRRALLPPLASGELTATLAVPAGALPLALGLTGGGTGGGTGDGTAGDGTHGGGAVNGWSGDGRAGGIQARRDGEGWRLYGEAAQVLNGHTADRLLVAAHTGGFARSRTLLFLVGSEAERDGCGGRDGRGGKDVRHGPRGLVRVRQTSLDETRTVARLELRDVPAVLLGESDEADVPSALVRAGARVAALLAAEAVGAAESALGRTVEYTTLREQFGRPVGSFQAVQHRLADVYVQVRSARSATYYAAWAADADPAEAETAGGLALAQALEALRLAAGEAVQLHGGVGFTWEHTAHLYFKRAAGDDLLFGPVHRLRAHAAERAGLFARDAPERTERTAARPEKVTV
ncbi:acyl-CoA dehydrogenase family protein [Streptomyces sp. NPDC048172]|uniref:acyl-CoA dehydrogenase family protein n=1 Tax=Streptomyces sp. NPDC048172 TaxID=3365505 RepID=UPI00371A16B6